MEKYELTVIVDPDLAEDKRKQLLEKISGFITKAKGKIDKTNDWGRKTLAYLIKKKKEGYYLVFEFTASPSEVQSLNQKVKLEEDLLRHLLIRKE